jgi:hypothetical protein
VLVLVLLVLVLLLLLGMYQPSNSVPRNSMLEQPFHSSIKPTANLTTRDDNEDKEDDVASSLVSSRFDISLATLSRNVVVSKVEYDELGSEMAHKRSLYFDHPMAISRVFTLSTLV